MSARVPDSRQAERAPLPQSRTPRDQRASAPFVFLSADWSKGTSKRVVFEAHPSGAVRPKACRPPASWILQPSPAPDDGWSVRELLARAEHCHRETGLRVWIGIDACLGLPSRFCERLGERGFAEALARLERAGALRVGAEVASPSEWRPERPFFRVPPGRGGRLAFEEAAGGRDVLLRSIEALTRARSVFILSGIPGSVGSGSSALWRELAPLVALSGRPFALWPFEGTVRELSRSGGSPPIVLAETYPRASYAVALARSLPTAPLALAKTDGRVREKAVARLCNPAWLRAARVEIEGLEDAAADEDSFDALFAAAALVRLVAEARPLAASPIDESREGGILGSGGLRFDGGSVQAEDWADLRVRSGPRRRPRRASGESARLRTSQQSQRCPIPGCRMRFERGRSGWNAHVGSYAMHPDWHPGVREPVRRRDLFRREFGDWFPWRC